MAVSPDVARIDGCWGMALMRLTQPKWGTSLEKRLCPASSSSLRASTSVGWLTAHVCHAPSQAGKCKLSARSASVKQAAAVATATQSQHSSASSLRLAKLEDWATYVPRQVQPNQAPGHSARGLQQD